MKKILFSLVPLLILALLLEIGGRCFYYQRYSLGSLAVIQMFEDIVKKKKDLTLKWAIEDFKAQIPMDMDKHEEEFFSSPSMAEKRREFCEKYEVIFKELVRQCKVADALLVVLYIPGGDKPATTVSRPFFLQLCRKFDIPILDLTEEFRKYPVNHYSLWPEDGHMSRFGNSIIAERAVEFLKPYLGHRTSVEYSQRPRLLGDFNPNWEGLTKVKNLLVGKVVTNSQGLRRQTDLRFPKPTEKTRILVLGDSFTYGAYMSNPNCFPQLMEKKCTNIEVVNAGKNGYTICDEYSYFVERGRFTEPDIVLLQVFYNDLYGFFPFLQKLFCRGGKFCPCQGKWKPAR